MIAVLDVVPSLDGTDSDLLPGVENVTEVTRPDTMIPDSQLHTKLMPEVGGKVLTPITSTADTPN